LDQIKEPGSISRDARGRRGLEPVNSPITDAKKGGLHMNNEPNTYLGQEAPQWMKDMFSELNVMLEELCPDADRLKLEEELFPDADRMDLEGMQRTLDEQGAHAEN
jgi:hypothetical protein